jgi:hypothetical protein
MLDAVDWDGIGLYWHEQHPPGHHGEGKHCASQWGCGWWAEYWWAPSKLWREKWCYLGLHWWMRSGHSQEEWPHNRDYWREGYFWQRPKDGSTRGPSDAARWCARCPKRKGRVYYRRPDDVRMNHCPGCGITDAFVAQHAHASWCSGDDRGGSSRGSARATA